MAAPVCGPWKCMTLIPTGGPCVHPCPSGEGVWVWLYVTAVSMPLEATMHLPLSRHPSSLIVWKGRCMSSLNKHQLDILELIVHTCMCR